MTNQNKIPFYYSLTTAAMAGNGTDTKTINIAADADFELTYFLGSSSVDLDTDFMPNNFKVKITDQSSGRLLTSDYINQRNICGPSNGTLYQRYPVIFKSLSEIVFDFVELSGGTNTVNFVMAGYKIFQASN